MDLRFFNWISHRYLLLILLLIDSLWKCLIQIILKLSSAVSRSSVSVYQVTLARRTEFFFQAKLRSVRIFFCQKTPAYVVIILCNITSYRCTYLNARVYLWTHAQRASMLYFADVFIGFFMAALVGQTAERIFTKLSHVVDIRHHLWTY